MIAFDSSVAVPALNPDLPYHDLAFERLRHAPALPLHAAVETFSALTRIPEPFRLSSADAARLIGQNFGDRILTGPQPRGVARWLQRMAGAGIAGGAIYDALIAESARIAGVTLVTADRRAAATYRAVGVEVEVLGE